MSKNYAIIIHFMLPLTTFYRSGAHRSDVYKWDAFVTSWRFYNRAWQPQRHDRLPETSGTLWIHRGALTNQRCSLATGCGIMFKVIALLHSILYYISSRLKRTQHFFIIKCKPILIIWKKNMENPIKHVRINIKLFLNAYLIYWRSLINTSDAFYLRKCASALWHE